MNKKILYCHNCEWHGNDPIINLGEKARRYACPDCQQPAHSPALGWCAVVEAEIGTALIDIRQFGEVYRVATSCTRGAGECFDINGDLDDAKAAAERWLAKQQGDDDESK